MNKEVLFISIDGMTDMLGQAQVLPYLAGLSSQGYRISIASCEKEGNFKKNSTAVNHIIAEYHIEWHYCFYKNKIPLISQIQNFFSLKKIAAKKVKHTQEIILHCRSYLPALIGLQLKQKYNTGFIFDMRGFWADERIDGNIWKLRNPIHNFLYKYFKRKEIKLIKNADYIVTLTNNAKNEIQSWQIKNTRNIEVIPCCADVNHFIIENQEERNATRKKLNIPEDAYVVGYLGSLGTWYMQDEMLDFFIELQKKKRNAFFFFITNDAEKDILKATELKDILSSSIRIRSAKRDEVPSYISCLDIGLFFIKPLYSKKGSSPTKLAELLACGIPVITNQGVGDVDELILDTKAGILVSSFNKEGYEAAIDKIATLNSSKQFYREIALANFSLQKGIDAYERIYAYLSSST
jgi:glycosyltransferase involved in cell wall biosynthesis